MISNRCARKSLVTNCNSIISKNYLRSLVDSNDPHNIQNLSNLALVNLQMHFFEDALFYAKLGLEEAAKQNLHTCDSDLNWVLNTLNNISGTSNSHV